MNMQNKPKGLGKGLSALIGDAAPSPTAPAARQSGNQAELPVSALQAGKYQPRNLFRLEQLQELADSIAQNGIMQPILVRPLDNDGKYEIVAGERRFRAAKIAGLQSVPVIIRDMSDKVALELAIVENIQRADLTPVEEAAGYKRLMDEFNYTQEQLSKTVGKSRSHVANLLRLLGLPDEVKEMLDKGEITMGHARAILGQDNVVELAQNIATKQLSVRQVEALVKRDPAKPMGRPRKSGAQQSYTAPPPAYSGEKDQDIIALENTLSENLGMKVTMHGHGNAGVIQLHYDSLEQLDEILRRLGGSF